MKLIQFKLNHIQLILLINKVLLFQSKILRIITHLNNKQLLLLKNLKANHLHQLQEVHNK